MSSASYYIDGNNSSIMMKKIENFRLLWDGCGWATQTRTHKCSFCEMHSVSLFEIFSASVEAIKRHEFHSYLS